VDIKTEIDAYINGMSKLYGILLNADEQKRRYAIKQLLHVYGLNHDEYFSLFSQDLHENFPFLREWEQKGYVKISQTWTQLTALGLSLSDYLGSFFISDDIQKLMTEKLD
jgi:oxygen-independent coproporphyrinogen-3 oxidase